MAAVLVLLAGGANGLAYNVICVPNLSVNPSCTVVPITDTIQGAVTAASPFDIIFVGPGTYKESVTISTNAISLFGAQAGNDAREDRHNANKESIVDATGKTGPAFNVTASYVVIDGFTVQGGTAGTHPAGIAFGSLLGPQVLNNILQNNSTGVYLSSVGGAAIERNLFRNNNADLPLSTSVGFGIFSMGVQGLVVTENEFTGNRAAAMVFLSDQGATITKNTSENDGSFVIFLSTTGSQFSHNRGKNFGHAGVLPALFSKSADAAVDIAPGNSALEISYNDLENGKSPICNGIAFTKVFVAGTSHLLDIINNKIERFPGYGIVAEDPTGSGTLYNSSIIGNEVEDNGSDGIYIDGVPGNSGNLLFDNEAEGNHGFDCHDDTSGSFTLATANTWFNNTGSSSSPNGLCRPGRRHDHD
jgi:hypothetical protein